MIVRITTNDNEKAKRLVHVDDAFGALSAITEYLRQVDRYQDPPDDIEKIRERVFEIIHDDHSLDLDDLWS